MGFPFVLIEYAFEVKDVRDGMPSGWNLEVVCREYEGYRWLWGW
jgi:hypothetical protein